MDSRIVSLVSQIRGSKDAILGRVEVTVSFDELMDQVVSDPWWKGNKGYLIDDNGNVLVGASASTVKGDSPILGFGTDDKLEQNTLTALRIKDSGIVFGMMMTRSKNEKAGSPFLMVTRLSHGDPWLSVPVLRQVWFFTSP